MIILTTLGFKDYAYNRTSKRYNSNQAIAIKKKQMYDFNCLHVILRRKLVAHDAQK